MNPKVYFQLHFFPDCRLQCVTDIFVGLVIYSIHKPHTELTQAGGSILSPQIAPPVTINTSQNRNSYYRLSFERDFLLLLRFTIDLFAMQSTTETWRTYDQVYQTPFLLSICSQNAIGSRAMLYLANCIWVSGATKRILSSLRLHFKHFKWYTRLRTISLLWLPSV